jgi:hypothetical protein
MDMTPMHDDAHLDVQHNVQHDVRRDVQRDVQHAREENGAAAAEARGILDGIAESLRTLAGREGHDGAPVAIFPRGVDVLEVRMHISREQDIDVNLRVAGPAHSAHPALDVS